MLVHQPERRNDMRARLTKMMAGLGVVAAIAVGGATFASAASKSAPPTPPAPPAVTTPAAPGAADGDTLQQGDQTAPDTGPAAAAEQASESASSESAAPESTTESSSEVAGNDGPGGHADEPGNANADHQFQGQE
jgi:hypothetical protein